MCSALLNVYSARDGSLVKSNELPFLPAFDGMIAVRGRLYVAGQDGKLICLAGSK